MPCFRSRSVLIHRDNSIFLRTKCGREFFARCKSQRTFKEISILRGRITFFVHSVFRKILRNSQMPFLQTLLWSYEEYRESKYDKPLWICLQIRVYESVKTSRETGKFGSRALTTIFLFIGDSPREVLYPLGDRSAIRKRERENKGQ